MALTLDDLMKAPTDPEELNRHLLTNGLIPPPPPPEEPAPLVSGPVSRPLIPPAPEVSNFKPPEIGAGNLPGGLGETAVAGGTVRPLSRPAIPKAGSVDTGAAPEIGGTPTPTEASLATGGGLAPITSEPHVPTLKESAAAGGNRKEDVAAAKEIFQRDRPQVTAPAGTSEFWQQKLERDEYDKNHPWGADISAHPGTLGKIGHVAGLIGQIAGSAVAPGIVEQIPGTQAHRQVKMAGEAEQLEKTRGQETAAALEKNKEKHEENIESDLQIKLQNAQDKIDIEQQKTLNARELGLRKQGLKPDPANPAGPPIPVTREDMSPTEQAVYDLKDAQKNAAQAKALLDQTKADPNSPQNKAIRDRIKIMAQNAGTAAEKLGLDKKKYMADYFGTDENGDPLAGVQMTPEGKPVGPKIAGSQQKALSEFNHNYEKPANDVETGYQKFQDAYKDYKAGAKTGAASMVALSQHLATTFGSVKGARLNKDLIAEHKDAIGAFDRIQRFGEMLSSGQQLSDSQWKEFGNLIANTRKLAWQTSVKEANRANLPVNFLPKDLQKELNPQQGGGGGGAQEKYTQGQIVNHGGVNYKFNGGDWKDKKNWEKVPGNAGKK